MYLNSKKCLRKNKKYYVKGNKIYYRDDSRHFREATNLRAIRKVNLMIAIHRKKKIITSLCIVFNLMILLLGVFSMFMVITSNNYDIDGNPEVHQVMLDEIYEPMTEVRQRKDIIDTAPVELSEEHQILNLLYKKEITFEELFLDSNEVSIGEATLTKCDLPSKYYKNLDYSSFQPYMSYKAITNKKSPAYKISHSENSYTDENGLRRYRTTKDQFTVNGADDYIIALGTFYKTKGTAGERFLITTSNGAYTAITGDEKADIHTDGMNMFTTHNGKAGMIEWIVDESLLNRMIRSKGTITKGPVEILQGEITGIYKIN